MKKIFIFIMFLSLFSFFGCAKSKGFTKTIYVFDTTVTINLYEGNIDNLEYIVDMLNRLHKLSDAYHSYDDINNIYAINEGIKAGETHFNLDNDLVALLKIPSSLLSANDNIIAYEKIIMPSIGNLTNLWKKAINEKVLPDQNIITNIVNDISEGKYNYVINGNELIINNTEICFDLGSIIKGYAASKTYKYLQENNITKYLIDLGQSTILLGTKANGKGFNIAVSGTNYVIENVKNCFVGTASILERKTKIDEKTYHHIIDPRTGYPTNTYDSIVVICKNGDVDPTDLLSTYLMINPDACGDICNNNNNYHIYMFKDGRLVSEVGGQ